MTVAVQQPRAQEDGLDKLYKALQIGHTAYGIYSDYEKLGMDRQRFDLEKSRLEKQQQIEAEKHGWEQEKYTNQNRLRVGQYDPTTLAEISKATDSEYSFTPPKNKPYIKGTLEEGTNKRDVYLTKKLDPKDDYYKAMAEKARREGKDNEKFTQHERLSAGFASRMLRSEKVLDQLHKAGFDPTSLKHYFKNNILDIELAKDEKTKMFLQARRDFINSILRSESGAAISYQEFDSAEKQYFPTVRDSPAVLQQKKENRLLATEAMKVAAGGAFNLINPKLYNTPNPLIKEKPDNEAILKNMGQPTIKKDNKPDFAKMTTQQLEQYLKGKK